MPDTDRFAELKTNTGFYPMVAVALADPSTSNSAQSQRPYTPKGRKPREPRTKAPPGLHLRREMPSHGARPPYPIRSTRTHASDADNFAAQCAQKRTTPSNNASPTSKKTKEDHSILMMNFEMKDASAMPNGIHGTIDGDANCMVVGHDNLI